jgi:hypothetical protein
MTLYNVHLYREVHLTYESIEADTAEAAAAIALDRSVGAADDIDDCHGRTFAVVIDVAGDAGWSPSQTIDFESEQSRKATQVLVKALTACVNYLADDLDESDETEARIFRDACEAIALASGGKSHRRQP